MRWDTTIETAGSQRLRYINATAATHAIGHLAVIGAPPTFAAQRPFSWVQQPSRSDGSSSLSERPLLTSLVGSGRPTPEVQVTELDSATLSFDIELQHFRKCSIEALKIIAAVLEGTMIGKILTDLGMDAQPPPRGERARWGKTEAEAA